MPLRIVRMAVVAAPLALCAAQVWAQASSAETGGATAGDPVVARVNGTEIHRSEVVTAQQALPPQYRSIPLSRIFPDLLRRMVNSLLVAQAARAEGLDRTDPVRRRLAAMETQILEDAYVSRAVASGVTEEALRDRYEAFVKTANGKEEIRARHILLKTEEQAVAVIEELAGGADFAQLARKKSKGPSGAKGGDLGFFERGRMARPFSDAAYALEAGQVTPRPVKTRFGWHVIKVEEKRSSGVPGFEESRERLANEMKDQISKSVVEGLRSRARIEQFGIDGLPEASPAIRRVPN